MVNKEKTYEAKKMHNGPISVARKNKNLKNDKIKGVAFILKK